MYGTTPSSPEDQLHQLHHLHKKKRVGKACDSCRIKKTKCDGKKPCNKCIQDNKICVFTEKKKLKDKTYPSGYVELLETRLDLLTKSFEKIVQISAPHIPFLNELVMKENEDVNINDVSGTEEILVPINKIINHLISKQGLLKNLPLEWETGALVAANFDPNDVEQDSRSFANHKSNPVEKPANVARQPQVKLEDDELDTNLDDFRDEYDDLNENNMKFDMLMNNYSSGGFVLANSVALNDGLPNDLRDFESDSNSVYSQAHPPTAGVLLPMDNDSRVNPLSPGAESFKTPSLFGQEELYHGSSSPQLSNSSSRVSTFESSVFPQTQSQARDSRPEPLRRSSSILSRSRSPSHQRLKSLGHVHKPINHGHSNISFSGGNLSGGNLSRTHSRAESFSGDFNASSVLLDNDSLPSDSIKISDLNYDDNLLNDI